MYLSVCDPMPKKQVNFLAFIKEEKFACHLVMLHNAFLSH